MKYIDIMKYIYVESFDNASNWDKPIEIMCS